MKDIDKRVDHLINSPKNFKEAMREALDDDFDEFEDDGFEGEASANLSAEHIQKIYTENDGDSSRSGSIDKHNIDSWKKTANDLGMPLEEIAKAIAGSEQYEGIEELWVITGEPELMPNLDCKNEPWVLDYNYGGECIEKWYEVMGDDLFKRLPDSWSSMVRLIATKDNGYHDEYDDTPPEEIAVPAAEGYLKRYGNLKGPNGKTLSEEVREYTTSK